MRDFISLAQVSATTASTTFEDANPVIVEYPGYVQGSNEKNTEVEIMFDYMCPGSRGHLAQIDMDEENGVEGKHIFDVLNNNFVDDDDEMTYM